MVNVVESTPSGIKMTTSSGSSRRITVNIYFALFIEAIAVFVFISFAFGLLNYFNILRVDAAFPFLSFLPHLPRTVQQIKTQHAPNTTRGPLPTTEQFNYDIGKNTGLLREYLGSMLKQSALPPSTLQIGQSLSTNVASLVWNSSTPESFAGVGTMELSIGTNNIKRLAIMISPTTIPSQDTLSQDMIAPLFNIYFQPLPQLSDWKCISLHPKVSLCEQFKDEVGKKEGYGIALNKEITKTNPQPTFFLFSCRYLQDDPNYAEQTSCIRLRK